MSTKRTRKEIERLADAHLAALGPEKVAAFINSLDRDEPDPVDKLKAKLDEVRDANGFLRIENSSLRIRLKICKEELDELSNFIERFSFETNWSETRKNAGGTWLRVLINYNRALLDILSNHANDWEDGSIDLVERFDELMAERYKKEESK